MKTNAIYVILFVLMPGAGGAFCFTGDMEFITGYVLLVVIMYGVYSIDISEGK